MAQQEKSGLNEATEISAHAAGAVRDAIKTGKAVSGATKGTAAAGPYGAAAAALWTHRKAVVAIIAGLLAIPVLFIMLLPSLIFGGLTQAGSEGNPDSPILNDNAAIVENINQISQAISDLLEEGQEDVRARIDADFAASGADQKEIINPYESSPAYNANRFIAMYCAAKDQDYASISLKDMEALIRKAKDALYTFTSTEEPRTTTVTDTTIDQNTGNVTATETEVTEIWKIYTNSAIVTLKEVVPVDIETIGLNIRKCRNAKKMRQEDLAQKANVSSNYISAVERGVKIPSVETLIDIMNALGVSADMIFCDVIDAGVTEKNNQLDAKVSQLSTKDRKTVYDVLDLLVRDLSK